MSRQIDITDPENLSDDDLKYLQDRDRTDVMDQINYVMRARTMEAHPVANARIDAENERLRAIAPIQAQGLREQEGRSTEEVMVDDVPPYSEWTNDELREELKARDLPISGNKDELVARLEENDAELAKDAES